jgi:undecaprenyl diphosphate synthase
MKKIPNHIVVIPDGNRRWAKQHKLLAFRGHERGAERFREIADTLFKYHVSYVTFWAASIDNLTKRSRHEVKFLISLLQNWLQKELDSKELPKNEIRFRFIGNWKSILPGNNKLEKTVQRLETETKKFKKRHLTILFGYDGQQEMIEAIRKIKKSSETEINYRNLEKALWTGELPSVDLVIRTGGEPHWSAGFMMWQTANSQFYFTRTLWPEFKEKELESALDDFSKRDRRFGR